jgi:hypothetical protein
MTRPCQDRSELDSLPEAVVIKTDASPYPKAQAWV